MDLQAESQIRETLLGLESDSERGLPKRLVRDRLRIRGHGSAHFLTVQASHLLRPIRRPMAIVQLIAGLTLTVAGLHAEAGAVVLVMAVSLVARRWVERSFTGSERRSSGVSHGSISVIRDGRLVVVPGSGLVPGDVVRLGVGDVVPADGRIIEAIGLIVQQSAVTAQHAPVRKWALELDDPSRGAADRPSAVFAGSRVIAGHGSFVVRDDVGVTPRGRRAPNAPAGGPTMPGVLGKLERLELCVAAVASVSALTCLGMGWLGDGVAEQSLLAVGAIVVASSLPMPALASIALRLGARRMARAGVSIRDLSKVESLAGVTAICTDDWLAGTRPKVVTTLWSDRTTLMRRRQGFAMRVEPSPNRSRAVSPLRGIVALFDVLCLCNDSTPLPTGSAACGKADREDDSFLDAARLAGIDVGARRHRLPRLAETRSPDQAGVKTTLHRSGNATWQCLTRGPLEAVLRHCSHELRGGTAFPLTDERAAAIVGMARRLAGTSDTVTAGATRTWQRPVPGEPPPRGKTPTVFVGFAVLSTQYPPDSPAVVAECREAGIRVINLNADVAGDTPASAPAVGIYSGADLDALDDASLSTVAERVHAITGATQAHWERLVASLRRKGHRVLAHTTTGSHVPKSDRANLSAQSACSGLGVGRHSADLLLSQGGLSHLLPAIAEARRAVSNSTHLVQLLLAGMLGSTLAIVTAVVADLAVPFTSAHLLPVWLGAALLPGLSLVYAPSVGDPMKQPPPQVRGNLLSRGVGAHVLGHGGLAALVSLCALYAGLALGDDQYGRTMAVVAFPAFQCAHAGTLLTRGATGRGPVRAGQITTLLSVALGLALTLVVVYTQTIASAMDLSPLRARDAVLCTTAAGLVPAMVQIIKTRRKETHLKTASNGERGPR